MHTQAEDGIDVNTAQQLEREFTYTPPLNINEVTDADNDDEFSMDQFEKEWAEFEKERQEIAQRIVDGQDVVITVAEEYDKDELARVEQGVVPEAFVDEVSIHAHSGVRAEDWNLFEILQKAGIDTSM